MNLAQFEDESALSLQENLVLKVYLPRMLLEGAATEAIKTTGDTTESSTKAILSFNFVISLLLAVSLHQLFSLI